MELRLLIKAIFCRSWFFYYEIYKCVSKVS